MGGSGYGSSALRDLLRHPNFKMPVPIEDETPIEFSIRCVQELVSPEQEKGESNEIECVDLKAAIGKFESMISDAWNKYYQIKKQKKDE